jgi:sucrose-6-phosphate hydrolase SacC (GH32 family)
VNDVNGLCYLDGEYHLFAQRCFQCWVHAVSRDLIHWEELEPAFWKDEKNGVQSGGAVIDWKNVTGLGDGTTPTMIAFWSGTDSLSQCIAYSNDHGRTWKKYKDNPVLTYPFRDPKVFAYKDKWIMVLFGPKEGDERHYKANGLKGVNDNTDKNYVFFSSTDLLSWTKLDTFIEGGFECPDMFELPVDGDENNTKWVVVNGNVRYCLGRFDGETFEKETDFLKCDYRDMGAYASMTWDVRGADGKRRVTQTAWLRGLGEQPVMDVPFKEQHTFPCELSLHTTESGIRLFRYPIPEIEKLYSNEIVLGRRNVVKTQEVEGLQSDVFDATLEFDLEDSTCDELSVSARGYLIKCYLKDRRVNALGSPVEYEKSWKHLKLRILSDRLSIEVFLNDGWASFTNFAAPVDAAAPLRIHVDSGSVRLTGASIHDVRSMWG